MTLHLDRQLLLRFSLRLFKFLNSLKQKETCVSCLEDPTARCPDYAELSRNLRRYLQTLTPLSGNVPSTCTTAERSNSKSSLEAIQKTAAVILAAIQLPTAETDERTYAEAHESMEASNRNQPKSSRSPDPEIKLEAILEPHPSTLSSLPLAASPVTICRQVDHQTMLDVTCEPNPRTLRPPLLTMIPGHPPATLTVLLDQIARRPGAPRPCCAPPLRTSRATRAHR
jgi:hypothetical protein